jgi:hypothetical protein
VGGGRREGRKVGGGKKRKISNIVKEESRRIKMRIIQRRPGD